MKIITVNILSPLRRGLERFGAKFGSRFLVDVHQLQKAFDIAIEHNEIVAYERQRIIDFVRYAGGKEADGRQLFVLHQHRTDAIALGQIANGAEELDGWFAVGPSG